MRFTQVYSQGQPDCNPNFLVVESCSTFSNGDGVQRVTAVWRRDDVQPVAAVWRRDGVQLVAAVWRRDGVQPVAAV